MPGRRRTTDLQGRFRCPLCGQYKWPWEFYKNSRTRDGISSRCKTCHNREQKKYTPKEQERRLLEREQLARLELERQLSWHKARLEGRIVDSEVETGLASGLYFDDPTFVSDDELARLIED